MVHREEAHVPVDHDDSVLRSMEVGHFCPTGCGIVTSKHFHQRLSCRRQTVVGDLPHVLASVAALFLELLETLLRLWRRA